MLKSYNNHATYSWRPTSLHHESESSLVCRVWRTYFSSDSLLFTELSQIKTIQIIRHRITSCGPYNNMVYNLKCRTASLKRSYTIDSLAVQPEIEKTTFSTGYIYTKGPLVCRPGFSIHFKSPKDNDVVVVIFKVPWAKTTVKYFNQCCHFTSHVGLD